MFCGMIAPEKPPFWIAYRTRSTHSRRVSKFGPSVRSRVRTLAEEPIVAAALKVWQPAQRCWNSSAPACWGLDEATSIFCSPQAASGSARATASRGRRNDFLGRSMRPRIIRKNPAAMPSLPLTPAAPGAAPGVRALAMGLAAVLVGSSGCGEPAPVAVDATPLRLTVSEYRIEPQAVRVPAGRVELVVRNAGTMVHRLEIRTADRARRLAATPPLRPGETARLTVKLPPGRYLDTCAIERHDTLGEHGTIVAR